MAKATLHTIKFLADCVDSRVVKTVLLHASNKVIKSICNAADNANSGDVGISPKLERYFEQYRKVFQVLVSTSTTIAYKSNYIKSNKNQVHKLIPPLLTCVIESIGTAFVIPDDGVSQICSDKQKRVGSHQRETNPRIRSKPECSGEDREGY